MLKFYVTVGPTTTDYTRYLDGSSIQVTEQLNIPSQMTFNLEPSSMQFVLPVPRAYVQLYSTKFERSLYTGFVSAAPKRVFMGIKTGFNQTTLGVRGGQHFQYQFTATSDEYLLNLKAIPFIPAYVNQTQGQILANLANILCPGYFDTSNIAPGDNVAYYLYDPTQTWSEVAKTFGDGSRYRYRARDKQLFYQPYGDQPLGIFYDESQPDSQFSPLALQTSVLAVPVVNDCTMVGAVEAGNNREDYVVGDGFTANVPLLHKVFQGASTTLLNEPWNELSLNLQYWYLNDPGDNFDLTAGALNIVDTLNTEFTLGDSYLSMVNGLEIAGGLDLEHGEFTFNDYCHGVIGGLYNNSLFNATGLLGGFVITSQNVAVGASGAAGVSIQPWWVGSGYNCNPHGSYLEVAPGATGTAIGNPVITQQNHNYVLQTLISAPQYARYQTIYRTVEGEEFGGATTVVLGSVTFYVQDYDITQATGFFYQPNITQWTIYNVPLPAFATYAIINNLRMNLTDTNTLIAKMVLGTLDAAVGTCGLIFPTGLIMPALPPNSGWHDNISGYIGGVDASLLPPFVSGNSLSGGVVFTPPFPLQNNGYVQQVMGNGLLELPAAQITQGNEADTLGFYSVSVPSAGSRIRLQTWEAQAAVSRLQNPVSISGEAFVVGDDGLRATIVTNLNPLPRTSEDCDNAALAFLADRGNTFYNGTYTWVTGPPGYAFQGLSSDQQFFPCCGRFLNVNSPLRDINQQKFLVTQITTSVLDMVQEVISWQLNFGADLFLEKVLANFVDTQPSSVLLPSDTANPPNPRFIQNVDSSYLPDLNNTFCQPLGINEIGVTVNVNDFYYGPIEVRRQDTNWGRGPTPDLLATVMGPVFTLPRTQYDQVWYMRPVQDNSSYGLVKLTNNFVQWVEGAKFNIAWQPGQVIKIRGLSTTILNVLSATGMFIGADLNAILFPPPLVPEPVPYTVFVQGTSSRRSKVLRVRYPLEPSYPLLVSFIQGLLQLNFNADIRSEYGIEIRTPPGSGTLYSKTISVSGSPPTQLIAPPSSEYQLYIDEATFNVENVGGHVSSFGLAFGPSCSATGSVVFGPQIETAGANIISELYRQLLPPGSGLCFKPLTGNTKGAVTVQYGIAPNTLSKGQMVLWQRPIASYADLNVDIVNQTPYANLPAYNQSDWEFWCYFFNQIYGYSQPMILTFPNGTPGQATFDVAREGYGMLTINNLQITGAQNVTAINFLCPSIDETDIGLYMVSIVGVGGSTAPTSTQIYQATGSRYTPPVLFNPGDFVIWNDPNNYEINQISALSDQEVTLLRADPNSPGATGGFFGSTVAAHAAGMRLYRLIPKYFSNPIQASGVGNIPPSVSNIPEKWEFPWPNKCVAAVVSQCVGALGGGPTYTLNLAPGSDPQDLPPAPGLRTMNGAAYMGLAITPSSSLGPTGASSGAITGSIVAGQTAAYRARVQAWESIRTAYVYATNPVNGSITIAIMYITSDGGAAALIDQVTIAGGSVNSYPADNPPDGRQMPYHAGFTWPTHGTNLNGTDEDFPPNLLPYCSGAIGPSGGLQLPITPNHLIALPFSPDGYIDMIVTATSATGSNSIVGVVQS